MPLGDKKMPSIAAEDIGRCAYGVFKRPELIGKRVGIAGEHVSGAEMASGFSKVLGEEVRYHAIEPSAYRALGFPGSEDLGNMFQFYRDFEADFRKPRDVQYARELNPQLQDFAAWLKANKGAIKV